jgi:hypothetical protein
LASHTPVQWGRRGRPTLPPLRASSGHSGEFRMAGPLPLPSGIHRNALPGPLRYFMASGQPVPVLRNRDRRPVGLFSFPVLWPRVAGLPSSAPLPAADRPRIPDSVFRLPSRTVCCRSLCFADRPATLGQGSPPVVGNRCVWLARGPFPVPATHTDYLAMRLRFCGAALASLGGPEEPPRLPAALPYAPSVVGCAGQCAGPGPLPLPRHTDRHSLAIGVSFLWGRSGRVAGTSLRFRPADCPLVLFSVACLAARTVRRPCAPFGPLRRDRIGPRFVLSRPIGSVAGTGPLPRPSHAADWPDLVVFTFSFLRGQACQPCPVQWGRGRVAGLSP